MLKIVKLFLFSIIAFFATAQSHQFVYIENLYKQPFSIKINGKTLESTGKNFITLPKLDIGNHTLLISTENSKDNKFTLTINEEDAGYTLKQNENNDWVLFDINRFTTIEQDGKKAIAIEPVVKQDIIENPTLENKINSTQKNAFDSIAEQKTVVVEVVNETKKVEKTNEKSKPKKIYNSISNDGLDQIYVDINGNKMDTISIFIPKENFVKKDTITESKAQPLGEQKMQSDNIDIAKPVANNCKVIASEKDVADFSSKLQTASVLKAKLKVANLVLKEKCYSVNQIKRLSVLFTNDSGKYNFFKLAQPAISDLKNFVSLVKEIKDEKLQEELKALTNP
jgi:hypothetical protein